MQCPSCKNDSLSPSFIEDHFRAHTCTECHGNWILIEDFITWNERSNGDFNDAANSQYQLVDDSKMALTCPMTGTIMQKYRIANDTNHKLDYSRHIGGVWLDSGEWEYLKEHNLASQISSIFTEQWQKQIRKNGTKATFTDLYKNKFGEEDYHKAQEVREWLENSDSKLELRAYLLAQNPYGA